MKKVHLCYLSCPKTSKSLRLEEYYLSADHVMEGLLIGPDNIWYPIIKGVPRLLTGSLRTEVLRRYPDVLERNRALLPDFAKAEWRRALRSSSDRFSSFDAHQLVTGDSFAFEWQNIYQDNDFEKNNFLHFLSPYLKEGDFKGKTVIDAGCGSGRFTEQVAKMGPAVAIGSDIGESATVAFERTKLMPNVLIVQADIYQMPISSKADITMSIGVLHHLPEPEKGFCALKRTLKKGSQVIIWVYARRHNARAIYFYEPLRRITNKMPKKLLFNLCYLPAGGVELINQLGKGLERIGAAKLAQRLPFSYYANFPFNMKLNDAFDVLATPKSNYYYPEELVGWYKRCGYQKIRYHEHQVAGITITGQAK